MRGVVNYIIRDVFESITERTCDCFKRRLCHLNNFIMMQYHMIHRMTTTDSISHVVLIPMLRLICINSVMTLIEVRKKRKALICS